MDASGVCGKGSGDSAAAREARLLPLYHYHFFFLESAAAREAVLFLPLYLGA